jgi:cytochrome c oxidase assembly factor CtaG
VLSILVYTRGFLLLRRTRPSFSWWRLTSFTVGLSVLWIALGSPLEELADTLLSAHMLEHLLLMSAVPPLLLVGWPAVPLLRGLPTGLRRSLLSPLLRSQALRSALGWLERPVIAWLLMNLTLLAWHIPAAYDFALEHEGWHVFEHVCFLSTSLLFWWVLLRPWPARVQSMGWGAPLYLISADIVNTALSATLAFIGHPVYAYYLQHENGWQLDPASDQTFGASLMWVLGSVAFLLPALVYSGRLLQPVSRHARNQ